MPHFILDILRFYNLTVCVCTPIFYCYILIFDSLCFQLNVKSLFFLEKHTLCIQLNQNAYEYNNIYQ